MRDGFGKYGGLAAVGVALMLVQGCKTKPAPVVAQPVVRTVPRVAPVPSDFPTDPAPVPDSSATAARQPRRRRVATPVDQVQPVDSGAAGDAQRRRDAALLHQQQVTSQKQQQELNGVVQQSLKVTQQQQAEPRIQEAPEVPISQPTQDEPRIQDAPGPAQTNPVPPQAPPQS